MDELFGDAILDEALVQRRTIIILLPHNRSEPGSEVLLQTIPQTRTSQRGLTPRSRNQTFSSNMPIDLIALFLNFHRPDRKLTC